ncbi:MAG: glycoside hydrolase family 36 protein [Pyrinomonadaceae bacterium]
MNYRAEKISRRHILRLTLISPLAAAVLPIAGHARAGNASRLDKRVFLNSPSKIVPADPTQEIDKLKLDRQWKGDLCHSSIVNNGTKSVRIREIVLFEIVHALPGETHLYGEGFQMLSQTGGTLAAPVDYGSHTDAKHYKMPIPTDTRAFYGMMTLAGADGTNDLLAFTSCRRFNGQFLSREGSLQVVVDAEGLELKPGETWELEEFTYRKGTDRGGLLDDLATRLNQNHPRLQFASPPAGWCSWYCFGPRVTAQQVLDNLDFIAKNSPDLKYIQIDDGYQPAMGDWLETGAAFGGDVQGVLKKIRERGFEPAIWVGPFVAEERSNVFRQHPDWFVKGADGKPLRSDTVTFGGWRRGPWYALDGTHPETQKHLEAVFGTMRNEWGVTYFKLDANFWGAIHGGKFYDPNATRIEAYRRGMKSVIAGAGDGFILGCNHPIWASAGLVHGSRSSNDIKRTWDRVKSTARQNLSRCWQNGQLWWNDPDAVVLTGDLKPEEYKFHATAIYASGGMILSGDDLTKISLERLEILKKLVPPQPVAASFKDDSLRVGIIENNRSRFVCVFNWEETPQTISFGLPKACSITDFWSDEKLGRHQGSYTVKDLPPRSAKLLVCE